MTGSRFQNLSYCVDTRCPFSPRIVHMVPRLAANPDFGLEPTHQDFSNFFPPDCTGCKSNQDVSETVCDYCIHLRLYHLLVCSKHDSEAYPLIQLGNLDKIRERRDCSFCSMVSNMFQSSRHDRSDDIQLTDTVFMFPFVKTMETELRRKILAEDGETPDVMFFLPTEDYYTEDIFAVGVERYARVVNTPGRSGITQGGSAALSHNLDKAKLVSWIDESFACHDKTYQCMVGMPDEFRVIDISQGCISAPSSPVPYAALSYVWGQSLPNEVELTLSTLSLLSTPGSLSTLELPASISDAITLCRSLSMPYLWVDRLCIVQDDMARKHDQIFAMDTIYSAAVFTICATAGDSSRHGLPGIGNTPRRFARKNMVLSDCHLIEPIMPGIRECILDGIWFERGWCFQEILFGGRLLLFTEWQVFYRDKDNVLIPQVASTEVQNAWTLGNLEARDIERRQGKMSSTFQRYVEFVQEYSGKQLSFVSDTFEAFAGVFRFLYGDINEYIYGMPEKDFDSCQMWKAQLDTDLQLPNPLNDAILPSWSWGSLMHWSSAILYRSDSVVATMARWAQLQPDGHIRLLWALNDPTAHMESYRWERGPYSLESPRSYLLAAWPACIEAPSPKLEGVHGSSEVVLKEKWPTYAHFWNEAFNSTPFPIEPLQASILANRPGRIAVRSSTNSFRLWVAPTPVGRSHDYYIIGPQGWCIGTCSIPFAIATYHSLPSQGLIENHRLTFLALSMKFESKSWWFDDLKRYLPKEENRKALKILPMSKDSPPYMELRDSWTDEILKSHPVLNVMLLGWKGDVAHRIWLGTISLACWVQFNPKFQTIVLE